MANTAYNPYDATQAKFLAALAYGETGQAGNAYSLGFGGVDLSGYPTTDSGFPIWNGGLGGSTHAAGAFQFQPGTWNDVNAQLGGTLNFQNPQDQNAAAWQLAQSQYSAKTGRDLYTDLSNGDYSYLNNALQGTWTSAGGTASNPFGLAGALSGGTGSQTVASTFGNASGIGSGYSMLGGLTGGLLGGGSGSSSQGGSSIIDYIKRAGLILFGAALIIVALWVMLTDNGHTAFHKLMRAS